MERVAELWPRLSATGRHNLIKPHLLYTAYMVSMSDIHPTLA